jgi:hypothetical protein
MTDRSCPECEAPLEPDARFCVECGAALPPASEDGDSKEDTASPEEVPSGGEAAAPPEDAESLPLLDEDSDGDDALPTLEDDDLTLASTDDDSGFNLDILEAHEGSNDASSEPAETQAASETYSLAAANAGSAPVVPSPPLPPRRAFDEDRRDEREPQSAVAYWLERLGKRSLEIVPELSIAVGGSLVGVLILYAPYNKIVGGVLIGLGAAAAIGLLILSPDRVERSDPQDAVQAYFQALSEYLPNYRRMYRILTAKGRKCADFSTLQSFRAYWRFQLCRFAPLRFGTSSIEFHPTGLEVSEGDQPGRAVVTYQLEVSRRSRADDVLKTFSMRTPVVCGPDELWYVGEGRLQQRSADANDQDDNSSVSPAKRTAT